MNPQEPKANKNFGKWLSNLLPKFIFIILVFTFGIWVGQNVALPFGENKAPLLNMNILGKVSGGVDRGAGDALRLEELGNFCPGIFQGELGNQGINDINIQTTKARVVPRLIHQDFRFAQYVKEAPPVIRPQDNKMDIAILTGVNACRG